VKIECFNIDDEFLLNKSQIVDVIYEIIKLENCEINGELGIIFVDNSQIQELNKKFLNHDYPTDVIAFPIEDDKNYLEAEIYINVERAKDQAMNYKVTQREEIWRLMIHGVLHLLGYDDQLTEQKQIMIQKENIYLEKFGLNERRPS
jgi:rRNA maturation RNase YbeY